MEGLKLKVVGGKWLSEQDVVRGGYAVNWGDG